MIGYSSSRHNMSAVVCVYLHKTGGSRSSGLVGMQTSLFVAMYIFFSSPLCFVLFRLKAEFQQFNLLGSDMLVLHPCLLPDAD